MTIKEAIYNGCKQFLLEKADESTRRAIQTTINEIVKSAGVIGVFVEAAYDMHDYRRLHLVWHGPEFDLSPSEVDDILSHETSKDISSTELERDT